MMKSNTFWCLSALVAMLFACSGSLHAQWLQEQACPGWNNPQNFSQAGDGVNFYYQARLGKKIKNGSTGIAPNMTTGETGYASEATYSGSASIAQGTWDTISMKSASQMDNVTITGQSDHAAFPQGFDQNRAFAIYSYNTPNASSGPVGYDANTGNGLPYVPTSFNTNDSLLNTPEGNFNTTMLRSIRIGDAYGGTNATGLYYNMKVNSENAMFFIYYACVIPRPTTYTHGISCDPAFIIRVCKKNAQNKWVSVSPYRDSSDPLQAPNSAPYCDSLAYAVSSTPATDGGTVVIGQNGWHEWQGSPGGNGTSSVRVEWKEWEKVSLNLSNFYGENIRIEVMVSDCCQTQHYAYAYIAGECRPMSLASSGCPAGRDTSVTTLSAPMGLQSYVWYASEFGKGQCTNPQWFQPGGTYDYYTWRRLTTDSTAADAYKYQVRSTDFRVSKRGPRNNVVTLPRDSTGIYQYFRCKMVSALNPARPIVSNLYTGVGNTKPTMDVKKRELCGGDVKLRNTSFVPGGSESDVDLEHTKWSFYDNANCLGTPIDTLIGDSISKHFDDGNTRYVLVRSTNTPDPNNPSVTECYSEAIYPIIPMMNPKAGMTLSNRVLCDDDEVTISDTSSGVTYRRWSFRPNDAPENDDSTMAVYSQGPATAQNQSVTRSFTHSVEPIELYVRNGLFYLNDTNIYDTTFCSDVAHDTVRVFLHPELEVTGDTIVCKGSKTNATVAAVGVDSCTYQWSTSNGTITGGLPAGATLRVEPHSAVETYYVRVTSPQQCVAWDSIRVYLVQPTLTMIPANGLICPGDTVTLIGGNADHYTWSASPVDSSLIGQDSLDFVTVTPMENTIYAMVGHGSNDCDADSMFKSVIVKPLPIPQVSYEPAIVDVDDPTVMLRNLSEYSVGADWEFANNETASGNEVSHTFTEATGSDTVYVTLSPYNELNCPVHYRFGIPVSLYNAWFPNIFTPNSEDENANFRMYANMPYEVFHVYIYNRRGEVVYESNSPEFSWDGTCDGVKCPQGAYVYVCRYRKPGMLTLVEQRGTVTLVR